MLLVSIIVSAYSAQARQLAVVAIVDNSGIGLLLGLMIGIAGPFVLWLLDTPDVLAADARIYLGIVAAAMIFNGFSMAAMSCMRAFGQTRTILKQGVLVAALFVAMEYGLVLGVGKIPGLGVTGAAFGVLFIRIVMVALLWNAIARVVQIRISLRALHRQTPLIRRLLTLSFPSVSDYIAYGFYQLILLGLVSGFGVAAVLSRTYTMIVMAFLILVIVAISQGNEVILGYRRGEGRTAAAHRQALQSCFLAVTVATLLAIICWLLADLFVALFTVDADVIALTRYLLFLTIFIQPGFAINTIMFQSLRAVGDVRWPVVVSLLVTWGFGLPLAWLLCVHHGLGVEGVWYALIIEETIKAGFMINRWMMRRWQRHDLAR